MKTLLYHAWERDGEIHESTICRTPELAEKAARVYCVDVMHDKPDPNNLWGGNAWEHMTKTGRVKPVTLRCKVVRG